MWRVGEAVKGLAIRTYPLVLTPNKYRVNWESGPTDESTDIETVYTQPSRSACYNRPLQLRTVTQASHTRHHTGRLGLTVPSSRVTRTFAPVDDNVRTS